MEGMWVEVLWRGCSGGSVGMMEGCGVMCSGEGGVGRRYSGDTYMNKLTIHSSDLRTV